ncbi:MAG: hypothetical protein J1E29_09335, partial [Duncaniella sp.]|nr:hypothetical protein [Duncaniella sp.]
MTKTLKYILFLLLVGIFGFSGYAQNGGVPLMSDEDKSEVAKEMHEEASGDLDVKETIFHHLGDGYGWEVPFSHVYRIPLPVIVRAEDGKWISFSSARLTRYEKIENEK